MSLHSGLSNTHGLRVLRAVCLVGCALVTLSPAYGQSTAEWLTSSADPARDAWQHGESKITTKNAHKLQLLWKTRVESKTMGMQSFREPLIVSGVKTADDARTVAILAGASNDVFALDAETGKVIWQTKLKWSSEKPQEPGEGAGFICTNALSATPVVSPMDASVRRLYVLTSDGYLHIMDLSTGSDTDPPIQVLPMPYGKAYGLNLVKNVLYTVTGQGCGGVPNALYAVNLENRKVTVSTPPQAGLWGTAGPAVGSDGTIYFESGDGPYDAAAGKLSTSVEAFTFSNDQLTLKDYYSPSNHVWLTRRDLDMNVTPVVFPLGPTGGETAVKFPKSYGATPNGGIVAFKLQEKDGKTELVPAWVSRDMLTSEPPIIVNGVVFVLAGGEYTMQANDAVGGLFSAEERLKHSVPAKLYALDAITGKELYSSGDQVTSFLHQAGPSVARDMVMFGTFDGTIYCFGLK